MSKQNIQIKTVLDVSIVDLCAADANFVTESPNELKLAIEKMVQTARTKIHKLTVNISQRAAKESSTFP